MKADSKEKIRNLLPNTYQKLIDNNMFEEVAEKLLDDIDDYKAMYSDKQFSIYDNLKTAIDNKDYNLLRHVLFNCLTLSLWESIYEVIQTDFLMNSESSKEYIVTCSKSYFSSLSLINNYGVAEKNFEEFIASFMLMSDPESSRIKIIMDFLSIPTCSEDEHVEDNLIPYFQSMICENDIGYYEVANAILNNDPTLLREHMVFLTYIRELYRDLLDNSLEVKKMVEQLKEKYAYGLERKKSEN